MKSIKQALYDYESVKYSIKDIDIELMKMELNRQEEGRDHLTKIKAAKEKELLRIDRAIRELEKREQRILKLRYFNNESWGDVAKAVGYSISWCKSLGKQALEGLESNLSGRQIQTTI